MFVVNPAAGAGKRDIRAFEAQVAQVYDDFTLRLTETAGDAERLSADASQDGYDVVVAVGGDGTVNEVGRGLLRRRGASLGIVPAGSGNGVARHLRIPMDAGQALRTLSLAEPRRIDVGYINDRAFFCTAGVGFDAHISRHFAQSRLRGLMTYARIAVGEYGKYRSTRIRLNVGEGAVDTSCFMLAFANASQWGNNMLIAPGADLSDGLLDVCLIDGLPFFRALRFGYSLAMGDLPRSGAAQFHSAHTVSVRAEAPLDFHADGEFLGQTDAFDVRLDPLALSVKA